MVGRRVRSWIAFVLSACLLLMSMPQAMAATTGPMTDSQGVELLQDYRIVQGDEKGNLHLDSQITRAEMAAIVVRAMGLENLASLMASANPFTDMAGYDWAKGYVAVASSQGLVKGRGNGTFDPGASITYAEAYTIFLRMVQQEPAGAWNPITIVNTARALGIAPSVAGSATANNPAIRGSVFGSLANAIAYVKLPSGKTLLQANVDRDQPTITLDQVPTTTTENSVVISGTAADGTSKVTVTVNGQTVPLNNGRFSEKVDLKQGSNTITIVATDQAGNQRTETRQISYSLSASRIDVSGPSQVKIGETATITATAYTADNKKIPAENVTVTVNGGIGTYDQATGKFTASSKAGTGSLVFKCGNVTKTFEITVVDPAKAAVGLRIRFSDEKIPYFIEGKTAVVVVEVIDKDGNVVTYDNGRKITLDVDGDADVEDNEATTKEGVAIFRVEADKPDEKVELTASSKGMKDATLTTAIATEKHVVLVPKVTTAPADGKTKVELRAYLRDKRGKAWDNDLGDYLLVNLDIDSDEAELDDDYVKIKDDADSSGRTYVIAGDKEETVVVSGELDIPDNSDWKGDEKDFEDDYKDLIVVPAVINFVDTGDADDETDEEDEDKDDYDGYFEIKAKPSDPDVNDEVKLTISVVDADGELLDEDEYAFQLRMVLDGENVDTKKSVEWDSDDDKLSTLLKKLDDFELFIGGNEDWIPLDMSSSQIDDNGYTTDQFVVGRTEDGECKVALKLPDFKGRATIYVLGHGKAKEAFNDEDDDEKDAEEALSTKYFKKDSVTIRF